MNHGFSFRSMTLLALGLAVLLVLPASAEDKPKLGWAHSAELSFLATSGNAETSTFGFNDKSTYTWTRALFTVKGGGFRAKNTTTAWNAVGTDPSNYELIESKATDTTAENYYLNGAYERKITDRFFWNVGVGWDRNRFAGINNRYMAGAGLGNIWLDDKTLKFKTNYGLTWTQQDDVVDDPAMDDSFAGIRLGWDFIYQFASNSSYENLLAFDDDLSDTSNWRGDMLNAVTVAMSKNLALKVSLRWLYDNVPALEALPLEDPEGNSTGFTVYRTLDKLDTIFSTSLVISF